MVFIISLCNKEKVICLKVFEQVYYKVDFVSIFLLVNVNGIYLIVGDVINIFDMFVDDVYVLFCYNGVNGYGIQVIMDEYGDVQNIVEQVNQLVVEWYECGILFDGVELEIWYDCSILIIECLDLFIKNVLIGIVMVFVVLVLFLNLCVVFWVVVGLLFILFGILFFMIGNFVVFIINEMIIFGFIMVLGIVVDDVVVVGEFVYDICKCEGDILNSIICGMYKVVVLILFGVFIMVVVFVVFFNIFGGLGNLYVQFGMVVIICLLLLVVEFKLILFVYLVYLFIYKKLMYVLVCGWVKIQDGVDVGLQWFS